MNFRSIPRCVLVVFILTEEVPVRAEETAAVTAAGMDFFEKRIRPVLTEQCFKCHSATGEKIKGGLTLDSRAAILKGGDTGPAVVPGNPEKSLLIEAIRYGTEELQMPPKHRLEPQQVKDFEQWVRIGAPDPRDGKAPAPQATPAPPDFDKARKFWSFQPIRDPQPPVPRTTGWASNEIDRFILAELEKKGLQPNPPATRTTLLRRATYDLTGLPPTRHEMAAFLSDSSSEAFAKVVDRLLASPAYGEQWGRHWLDVVRYADTSGCNSDFPIPAAYRYRNYVIDAFNKDKPYNQFVREQIAGDLLPSANAAEHFEKIIATGYLAISRRFGSGGGEFHLTLEDTIDNVGKAMLGLSVNCARCHDHKFDPILAKDYYALYGIFNSTQFAFPGTELLRHEKDFVPLTSREEAERFIKESTELGESDERMDLLKKEKTQILREEKTLADRRKAGGVELFGPGLPLKRTSADVQHDLDATLARQQELEGRLERVPKAYAVRDREGAEAKIQKKSDPKALGETVPRAFLTVLGGQRLPPEEHGSGRRELAEWLTDPANPLAARVMVNRIWQHHFDKAIVQTPNDFGARGKPPTHPELLDWLASRFVEGGWSVKAIHRLIMLSRAYQMSSSASRENERIDPANDFVWRQNLRRLSAEEIRDSLLAVAGALDRAPGGPHPFPTEAAWHYTQHRPFIEDYPTKKRAVYLLQQRIRKIPFLDVFDGADTNHPRGCGPLARRRFRRSS